MPVIRAEKCSKWYGHVLGISEISWASEGGIVGLLGPNGAGKSTLMKLMAGLLRPSLGSLSILGQSPFASAEVRRRIGYCPEHEGMYDDLTGLEFVTLMAELSGMPRAGGKARAAAANALDQMGLTNSMNRRIRGFSKGMRQRTKLAQTLIHDPDVILLDEPLTGVDPIARSQITDRIRAMGDAGKTVIISSHVLYEIEALTEDIVVIYRGQVLAEGNIYKIRTLIDKHPHRIRIECDQPRVMARDLSQAEHIHTINIERGLVQVETGDPDACYDLIAQTALEQHVQVRTLTSPDNNLSAVFDYLTGGNR